MQSTAHAAVAAVPVCSVRRVDGARRAALCCRLTVQFRKGHRLPGVDFKHCLCRRAPRARRLKQTVQRIAGAKARAAGTGNRTRTGRWLLRQARPRVGSTRSLVRPRAHKSDNMRTQGQIGSLSAGSLLVRAHVHGVAGVPPARRQRGSCFLGARQRCSCSCASSRHDLLPEAGFQCLELCSTRPLVCAAVCAAEPGSALQSAS